MWLVYVEMVPSMALSQSITCLRAISYRISSTPTEQLPRTAPQLAGNLWQCRDLLSASSDTLKTGTEAATLVHRFRTTIASLLQHRTIEGRWAAVVLAKATIEAGDLETLSKTGPWVKTLLGILKKPEPPTTITLTILTLTRIFMLTWKHQNLIREITTPALPTFVASCIKILENDRGPTDRLHTILDAFAVLIPRHPTIFRTHETHVRSALLRILSYSPSMPSPSAHYSRYVKGAASRVLVLLHHCAPKQTADEKWNESLITATSDAHTTCNALFRCVVETSNLGPNNRQTSAEFNILGPDSTDDREMGVAALSDKLVTTLDLISCHLTSISSGVVRMRIGAVAELITRLASVTDNTSSKYGPTKVNNDIPRDEREAMWSLLPNIHAAALELVNTSVAQLGTASSPVVHSLLQSATAMFQTSSVDSTVRTVAYRTIAHIIAVVGPSMGQDEISDLITVSKACCNDLLLVDLAVSSTKTAVSSVASNSRHLTSDSLLLEASSGHSATNFAKLQGAARDLLPILFSKLNAAHIPRKTRALMEQSAFLARHRNTLVASVMNPHGARSGHKAQASLLPLLAREYSGDAEVEALLRPRMPPLISKSQQDSDAVEEDSDEDENSNDLAQRSTSLEVQGEAATNQLTEDLADLLNRPIEPPAIVATKGNIPTASSPSIARNGVIVDSAGAVLEARQPVLVSSKRIATEDAEPDISQKRPRGSHGATDMSPELVETLPVTEEQHGTTAGEPVPATTVTTRSSGEPGVDTVTVSNDVVAEQGYSAMIPDIASDDSDFEMPPLTMEPDTDPEDEDDEEE